MRKFKAVTSTDEILAALYELIESQQSKSEPSPKEDPNAELLKNLVTEIRGLRRDLKKEK